MSKFKVYFCVVCMVMFVVCSGYVVSNAVMNYVPEETTGKSILKQRATDHHWVLNTSEDGEHWNAIDLGTERPGTMIPIPVQ